jgi:autotransporter-associated beta strand protein
MRFLLRPVCRVFLGTVICVAFACSAWCAEIFGPLPYGGAKTVNATTNASASASGTRWWWAAAPIGPQPTPAYVNSLPTTSWGVGGTSELLTSESVSGNAILTGCGPTAVDGGSIIVNPGTLALGLYGGGYGTGVTTVSAGTLQIATGGLLPLKTSSGSGTVNLTGSNSYIGGTTISAGTLQLGNPNGNGSTGSWQTIESGLSAGAGGTLVFDSTAASLPISGSMNLVSTGMTGGTYIDAGTLVDAGSGAIPGGTSLTVGAGATLSFNSTQAVASHMAVAGFSGAVTAVPEPNTLILLVIAVGSGYFWKRRSR